MTGCAGSSKQFSFKQEPLPELPANLRACAERVLPNMPKGPFRLDVASFTAIVGPQRKALVEKDGCAKDLVAYYDDLVKTRAVK